MFRHIYFTKYEKILWLSSVTIILTSFLIFSRSDYLTLAASLIGATSLIFSAKAHPAGQVLMIVFSVLYGIISYRFRYYGEMITYLGMTGPMALFALISWIRHPFEKGKAQVAVNRIKRREICFMFIITLIVTGLFYFILKYFDTANLIPSTLSVATSFIAVYLTFRRDPYFALAYASNDIVLIVLWILAALENISYLSVIICFGVFLVNDLYGFINWLRIEKMQHNAKKMKK